MAVLSKNGTELVRWQEVIQYPADNVDCIVERIRVYSFRSNGRILRNIKTVSNLFDKLDTYSTGWKRYGKSKASDLVSAADKIKANVLKAKSQHLKSGGIMSFQLI